MSLGPIGQMLAEMGISSLPLAEEIPSAALLPIPSLRLPSSEERMRLLPPTPFSIHPLLASVEIAPLLPTAPAPSSSSVTWTYQEVLDLLESFLLGFSNVEISISRIPVNGLQEGCRYQEMTPPEEVPVEEKKCTLKVQKDTYATFHVWVRPIEGENESRIGFEGLYDKPLVKDEGLSSIPHVWGFEFVPNCPKVPFYEEVDAPPRTEDGKTEKGANIKYIVTSKKILKKNLPLLGLPIDEGLIPFALQLFRASPKGKLDITEDFLSFAGLDNPAGYQAAGTQYHRAPLTARGFFALIRTLETDRSKIPLVDINALKGKPGLFGLLETNHIDFKGQRSRPDPVKIPHVGTLYFSPQTHSVERDKTAYYQVHGNDEKLEITYRGIEFSSDELKMGRYKVRLKGLSSETGVLEAPPLQEILRDGFNPRHILLKKVHADEIILFDEETNLEIKVPNVNLNSLEIRDGKIIRLEGLESEQFKISSTDSDFKLTVWGAKIPSLSLEGKDNETRFSLPQIQGDKIELHLAGSELKTQASSILGLRISKKSGQTHLELDEITSSGEMHHAMPSAGMKIDTSLEAKITDVRVNAKPLDSGEIEVTVKMNVSGTLENFSLAHNGVSLPLSKTVIKNLGFETTALVDPDSLEMKGLKYSLKGEVESAELDQAQMGPVTLSHSQIREAWVKVTHDSWDTQTQPRIEIAGNLNLNLDQIFNPQDVESFNAPGLGVSATLREVNIQGNAALVWDQDNWSLQRLVNGSHQKLTAKGKIIKAKLTHDLHLVPGNTLSRIPGNEIVKTEIVIGSAEIILEDIESISFSTQTSKKGESNLYNVLIHGIRIENIKGGGEIWAIIPPWGPLQGLFPEIGEITKKGKIHPSQISIETFQMTQEDGKPVTIFTNTEAALYEIGGKNQFATLKMPYLKFSPQGYPLVDTGEDPLLFDIYLKDEERGYSIQHKPERRPLEHRRYRLIKPAHSRP